jgi:hypothetical protein
MYFNEELLTDELYLKLNGKQQSELIANHCADMEYRIRSAQSREEAIQLKEMACTKFKKECQSTLVRTALIRYIDDLILHYWDSRKI